VLEQVIAEFETDNLTDISIDGDTAVAFTENVEQRFLSYGWQVLRVNDGDTLVRHNNAR
jgi:transketolase